MTEAMPFLQKAILLSYDPRPLQAGLFSFALRRAECYNQRKRQVFCVNELSGDELMFFDKMPSMLPVYAELRRQVLENCPGACIKVSRTQISFCSKYIFAMASLPWRRVKGWPEEYLLVSFGLSYKKESPRIVQAVEAYAGRWTHHLLALSPADIDPELLGWVREAFDFSLAKGARRRRE